jgi:hypothetical protein
VKNAKDRGEGGTKDCLKRKVFLKNQKHQLNIVEITHLCIMHGVHTSMTKIKGVDFLTLFGHHSYELTGNSLLESFIYPQKKELTQEG